MRICTDLKTHEYGLLISTLMARYEATEDFEEKETLRTIMEVL